MLDTILDVGMILAVCGLTYYDVLETVRRIGKYGPDIELNPVVRYLWKVGHPKVAVISGIAAPTAAILLTFSYFGLYQLVGFVAGAKAFNAFRQFLSRS